MSQYTPIKDATKLRLLFNDPELNRMRQAALANDFDTVFQIRPRGGTSANGTTWHGSKWECVSGWNFDGDLNPKNPAELAIAKKQYNWWKSQNPLKKELAVNDLFYEKDPSGNIRYVKPSPAHVANWFNNFMRSRHDYCCSNVDGQGQLTDFIRDANNGRVFWPLHQCAETSASRRRDAVKKVAIVAAAITGAVFLGPTAYAAAKSAGGAIVGGAKALGGAVTAGAKTVVEALNTKNTIDAIKDGKVPPPPIDTSSGSFTEWAMAIAQQQMGRQATAAEEEMLRQEILAMQREMGQYASAHPGGSYYPVAQIPVPIQQTMAASAADSVSTRDLLLIGIPLAVMLVATRS